MQYDPNENVGTSGSNFGASNASSTDSSDSAGSIGSTGSSSGTTSGSNALSGGTSYGSSQSTGSKAREKASQFKSSLADKLEQGAHRIRERTSAHQSQQTGSAGTSGAYAEGTSTGSTGSTGSTAKVDRTIDRASESLAHGMESTANWVRNADLDKMKGDVERQVRSNPGRALLVAVGVGYLLGKVLRGGRPRM